MENGAKVRTYGQTYGKANPGPWIDIGKGEDKISYDSNSYATYKIVFHNELSSIYATQADDSNFYVGYDTLKDSKSQINSKDLGNDDTLISKLKVEPIYVVGDNKQIYSGKGFNEKNTLEYNRDNVNFYLSRMRIIKSNNTKETITVSDWYLSENVITKLKETFSLGSNNNKIYFSLPAYSGTGTWDTSYQMLDNISGDGGWDPATYGKTVWYTSGEVKDLDKQPGKSAMNLFDNTLILPNEFYTPQEVYIRHVDSKGNLLDIANSSEIKVSSNNTKSVINNSGKKTIKRSDKTEVKYQEYYKINLGENCKLVDHLLWLQMERCTSTKTQLFQVLRLIQMQLIMMI